jgi:DNA-binding IclR family transcriptional regulator
MARPSRHEIAERNSNLDTSADEASGLVRGIEILRLITAEAPKVTPDRVVESVGCSPQMAERLLRTLVAYRYLRPLHESGAYVADVGALLLGRAAISTIRAAKTTGSALASLSAKHPLAIRLETLDRHTAVCIAAAGPSRFLRVGQSREALAHPGGHALIWKAPSALRIQLFELFEEQARGTQSRALSMLYRSLHQLEDRGYCWLGHVNDGERVSCGACLGVVEDQPLVAVEVTYADRRAAEADAETLGALCLDLVERLRAEAGLS